MLHLHLSFGLLLLCFFSTAQPNEPCLTLKDTIFIQVDEVGIRTYQPSVRRGQTIKVLCDFYQLSPAEWDYFNPKINNSNLQLGQKVVVPIPNRAIVRYESAKSFQATRSIPVYHVVRKGETFFRLYHTYYKIPADILQKRNGLTNTNVKVGQRIHIGWLCIDGIPPGSKNDNLPPLVRANLPYRNGYFQQIEVSEEWEHQGLVVRSDVGKLRSGFNVYHDSAKIGSHVRITNPMRSATIYAEVIGRIPTSVTHQYFDKKVMMVYSPTIGKALGVIDAQFYADVRFVK